MEHRISRLLDTYLCWDTYRLMKLAQYKPISPISSFISAFSPTMTANASPKNQDGKL